MASYNSADADIESFTSGDTNLNGLCSTPERKIQFLIFDCEKADFLAPGELKSRRASLNTEKDQRDIILSYRRPHFNIINSEHYLGIFGTNHTEFLEEIHSIIVLLPISRDQQVTFFVSKSCANTPIHVSHNAALLESRVPFCCRSLPKPLTLDNLLYVRRHEFSADLMFCHDYQDAESLAKTAHFNSCLSQAYYLSVVKCKTNIIKFVYHKTCLSSQTLHIECLSTDTVYQVLQLYLKKISKDNPEFSSIDVTDLSVTDDFGNIVHVNLRSIVGLLYNEQSLMKSSNMNQSYPTFLIHFTPKQHSYFPIKVHIHGEDRGHMHPFSVFIRSDFSTTKLRIEISKHCHWKPKSFEICYPYSQRSLPDAECLNKLPYQFNSKSVLSIHRIQKLKLNIECPLPEISSFTVEEYPACSIEVLKNKLSKRCNILPKQFDLLYRNKVLCDHTLLDSIIDKNATLQLQTNEKRIILKLYLHKSVPNRCDIDLFEKFVHVRVDDPKEEFSELISSFAQKLNVEETDLHLIQNGVYLEKNQTYEDVYISDGSIVCLCHCEDPVSASSSKDMEIVFQANSSGQWLQVTEASVAAMAIKLRKLQIKQTKKEPSVHIISRSPKNQKIFSRMISVPSYSRYSLDVDKSFVGGYKSDTELVRQNLGPGPKQSPSDSQLDRRNINSETQNKSLTLKIDNQIVSRNQYRVETLAPPTTVVQVTGRHRNPSLPSGTGIQLTAWSLNGNLPNITQILGIQNYPETAGNYMLDEDPWSKLFLKINKEIASEWKTVGRYLELGENNINIIDINNNQVQDKAYSMLKKWRELRGSSVTKEILIKALEESELTRVAEIVEGYAISPSVVSDQDDLTIDGLDDSTDEESEYL